MMAGSADCLRPQVRVISVMDIPHGWGLMKIPTLQREIWIHDPERQEARRGDEEPLAVLHVRFDSEFAVTPAALKPRGDDTSILGSHINFTQGVSPLAPSCRSLFTIPVALHYQVVFTPFDSILFMIRFPSHSFCSAFLIFQC